MDIIIRNGVIDKSEMKRMHEHKNDQGLLKTNFIEYNKNTSGPYYDCANSHYLEIIMDNIINRKKKNFC